MKTFDMNKRHAQLLELLGNRQLNAQQRQTLWRLIERAHETDIAQFQSTWIPTIEQHDHHFVEGLAETPNTKKLAKLSAILPLPCFCLRPPMVDPYEDRGLSATQLAPILKDERLAMVSHLDLSSHRFDDDCAQHLAQSSAVQHLKNLNLRGTPMTLGGLASLINANQMPALTELRLDFCRRLMWIEGNVANLSGQWPSLGTLSASSCELDDAVVARLAHALFERLHTLDLSQNAISTLDTILRIPNLNTLIMHNNQLSEGCADVLRSEHMPVGLTTLDLGNNPIGDAPAQAIADAYHFQSIERLRLYTSQMTDDGLCAIAMAKLPRLRVLDIPFNTFGDRGFGALAQSNKMTTLETLNCRGNQITDTGVIALTSAQPEGLVDLELGYNQIGPEGARAIAQCEASRHLKVLVLEGNPIGDVGAQALAQSPYLNQQIRQQYAHWSE